MRVEFKEGSQRKFLKKVLEESSCPSLRAFDQFGFDVPYSTLKNYYNESRLMPKDLFLKLCELIDLDFKKMDVEYVDSNWGMIKGGKVKKIKI